MKFEDRIQIYEYKLNDTDDQIIEYIIANKEEITNISIQKLSEKLFTVPNTIVRLSRKLAYEAFSELKSAIKLENRGESIDFSHIAENIKKTYEIMDIDTIERVAKKIKESKNVFFYGMGDSIYFCEMMAKNLRCVGKKAEFFRHHHDMVYNAENISSKDLVFIISNSGETKELIEAANIAKAKGAVIVSITHLCNNSLIKISDIKMYCWMPKNVLNNYNVPDRTSLMIVLRKLSEYYWELYK